MLKLSCFLMVICVLMATMVCAQEKGALGINSMKILKIDWQRLGAGAMTRSIRKALFLAAWPKR
jgi:hypothetical protein